MPTSLGHVEVAHASGAPAYGLRLACAGKIIAYSGDAEWTEALVELASEADLFICEAYVFEKPIRYHVNYTTLAEHRHCLTCRRLVLTHMSTDMLDRSADVDADLAEDGRTLTI
jgi:ribonuclease BN (tRNA processing enzyme)